MKIHGFITYTYLRISRWNFAGEPLADKTMVIEVPHTSNWDGVLMALSFWSIERSFHSLVKDSVMKKPIFDAFVKWIGVIDVGRTAAYGTVGQVVDATDTSESFTIILTPKRARSPREY